jgi:hypothetical protein
MLCLATEHVPHFEVVDRYREVTAVASAATAQTTKPLGITEILYRRLFEATETPGNLSKNMPCGEETMLLVEDLT